MDEPTTLQKALIVASPFFVLFAVSWGFSLIHRLHGRNPQRRLWQRLETLRAYLANEAAPGEPGYRPWEPNR